MAENYGKVMIAFNEKPITLDGPDQTGASIKEAAIDQGMKIKQNFLLNIERGSGKTDVIGDDMHISVDPDDRFVAIANDDNS